MGPRSRSREAASEMRDRWSTGHRGGATRKRCYPRTDPSDAERSGVAQQFIATAAERETDQAEACRQQYPDRRARQAAHVGAGRGGPGCVRSGRLRAMRIRGRRRGPIARWQDAAIIFRVGRNLRRSRSSHVILPRDDAASILNEAVAGIECDQPGRSDRSGTRRRGGHDQHLSEQTHSLSLCHACAIRADAALKIAGVGGA